MRVTYNSFYNALNDRLNTVNGTQQKALQQMSSGQKLTVASEDPTAMQRVLELRTSKSQDNQYWKNASDVTSFSKASTQDLEQLNGILSRAGELTTLGANQLNDATTFHAYSSETDQLLEQALTQANSRLGGKYLHGGTATDVPPFVAVRDPATNKITAVNYVGNSLEAKVRISEESTVNPYTDGAENLNLRDLMNNMVKLRDTLEAGDSAGTQALRPVQEGIEDQLLSSISRAGGIQYRLEVSQRQSEQRFSTGEKLISADADLDFAEASVRFSRAQTAYSAAVQSGAKIASVSLLDYIR